MVKPRRECSRKLNGEQPQSAPQPQTPLEQLSLPLQSESLRHSTQTFAPVSHFGVDPPQSPLPRHSTHRFAPVSHFGVDPPQSPLPRHSTHRFAPVSHFGVDPPQFPSAVHSTQVLGLALVSQAGRPETLAQSAAPTHGAQAPETQAAAVADVQFASDAHSTQPPETQKGVPPGHARHIPPAAPQALGVSPPRQVSALRQPVQQEPPPHTPPVHEAELFVCTQAPLTDAQLSSVQTLLSLQSLIEPPTHAPPEQVSPSVHRLPSLHPRVLDT
jgi:hypothetical protein